MAAMVRKTWFFIKNCPLAERCSAQSRKKANLWGSTEDEARDALKVHLMRSGCHQLDDEVAHRFAEQAEVESYSDDEDAPPGEGEPPQKRARRATQPVDVAAVVQETLRQVSSQSMRPAPPAFAPPLHLASRPSSSSGSTTIRIGQLQQAIDAVTRAGSAAKQAQRISAAAARAFGDEAAALDEAKEALESILQST